MFLLDSALVKKRAKSDHFCLQICLITLVLMNTNYILIITLSSKCVCVRRLISVTVVLTKEKKNTLIMFLRNLSYRFFYFFFLNASHGRSGLELHSCYKGFYRSFKLKLWEDWLICLAECPCILNSKFLRFVCIAFETITTAAWRAVKYGDTGGL